MDDRIHRLLGRMAQATLDGDHEGSVALYDLPVTFIRPTGKDVFETHDAFIEELKSTIRSHVATGLAAINYEILLCKSFVPGLVTVDVRWDFLDGKGKHLRHIFTTYILRHAGEDYRVMAHISHNEILERPSP